jgi:hypothetical protein
LHVIRRDQLVEAQELAEVDEKVAITLIDNHFILTNIQLRKRKRDDDDDDEVDEDLPPTKRSRVATVANSLACAAAGGLVVWAGLAFT